MNASRSPARRAGRGAVAALAGVSLAASGLLAAAPAAATPERNVSPQWAPVEPSPGQVESGAPTLNLQTGDRVNGTVPVVSSPSVAGANPTAIEVDGVAAADARPTLGSEALSPTDAALVMDVTAAVELSYSNYMLVNGARVAILEQVANTNAHPFAIPAELLTVGPNIIEFHTGTRASTCGINHDDVVIGNFRLQLPGGEQVVNPDNPVTGPAPGPDGLYNIGDGNCGSSSKPRFLTVAFDVDAEPTQTSGLLLELDTTAMPDGEHTVTAVAGEASTQETIVVDNTGPALVSSSPAAGDHLLGEVTLAAEVADGAGVASGPRLTLDGAPVEIGDTISSDVLPAGDHILRVEATDELGNAAVHTVEFTSAPSTPSLTDLAPEAGTTGVADETTLSVTATDPQGASLDVGFYAADPRVPTTAAQGTAQELPLNQLDFTGQQAADTDALAPGDDESLRSPAADGVTYQRFDVPVDAGADEQVVSWTGEVDPARGARLYVWDAGSLRWDLLQDARGTSEDATELGGIAAARHVDDDVVHLLVEGYDPFADDIGAEPDAAFRDPATYDFAIAHNTDTQYLSEGAVEQEGAAAERFRQAYLATTQWIADNAEERKIAYALHTGDLVNDDTVVTNNPEWVAHARAQYAVADEAQRIIDAAGIPNGVLPGNHDNKYGNDNGLYNEYFGPERYAALSESWEDAEYGGPWRAGDNQNHYDLFTAGGLDFVVVHLGYLTTAEELAWANEILAQYPDRNAIVAAHEYLAASTAPDGRGAGLSPYWGDLLFAEVISQNPNVFLVLSGHVHGVGTNVRQDVAEPGHHVVELLADYQEYLVDGEKTAGYLRMLQFDVDRSELTVDTYSARLDDHGATEHDSATNRSYDGREDELTIPVDLTTRTTSIATDSVLVTAYSDTQIGTTTADSGGVASVEWTGLEPGRTYGWYAVAETQIGHVGISPLATFTTAGEPAEPGDPGEPGEPTDPEPQRHGFFLTNGWTGAADYAFQYGRHTDEVVIGDWDGDGTDSITVRRGNVYHVNNAPRGGPADYSFAYGRAEDVVLVGDWDGDGVDTLAVRRDAEYHLKDSVRGGPADRVIVYGRAGDDVVVGDWDGNRTDTLAVRRGADYHVKNTMAGGAADRVFTYGRPGDVTLAGDWDGDGRDTFAVRRDTEFHVKNSLSGGPADLFLHYGRSGDEVYVGDWDGDGRDSLGVRRLP